MAACAAQSDAPIQNTYDACSPPMPTVVTSATNAQLSAVTAAETLWRTRGAPALGVHAGTPLDIRFDPAAPFFHGQYDDTASVIYINADLTDATALPIVIAHELGHAFGLVHVNPDERASLMNAGNLTVLPTEADQAALEALWGVCE
jgi:hypothetical protein